MQDDMPLPKEKPKDKFEEFVRELPFCRTYIERFKKLALEAHVACGSQNYVTVEELAKVLTTPAWEGLKDPESKICKVLLSPAFCKEEGKIRLMPLSCMALLCCQGNAQVKSVTFYETLQEGQFEGHDFIGANDKDFILAFRHLCSLSTLHLYDWAKQIDGLESPLRDDQK